MGLICFRFGRIKTPLTVYLIECFNLVVVRLKVRVLQRPFWRNTTIVHDCVKVLLKQLEQRSTKQFSVTANSVSSTGVEHFLPFLSYHTSDV